MQNGRKDVGAGIYTQQPDAQQDHGRPQSHGCFQPLNTAECFHVSMGNAGVHICAVCTGHKSPGGDTHAPILFPTCLFPDGKDESPRLLFRKDG